MTKRLGFVTRVILVASLALIVGLGVSCEKQPNTPPQPKVEKPATPATPAAAPQPEVKPAPAAEAPKPPAPAPAPAPQPAAAPAAGAKMVPINIELPKPMFVGTPQDLKVANLEKPLGKPRPPFLAPEGTVNLAKDKTIKASDEMPIIGEISYITDGDKEAADGSYVELAPLVQHITVDLGKTSEIHAIVLWHYHKQPRVYMDVVVQLSNDPDFIKDVKTVFNNDDDNSAGMGVGTDRPYVETNEGKLIDLLSQGSPKGRYVRFYSNGNTSNDLNHYIEVEVYGKPVE